MTNNDIKKALECMASINENGLCYAEQENIKRMKEGKPCVVCGNIEDEKYECCPFYQEPLDTCMDDGCQQKALQLAIDLISRQEAEIDDLQRIVGLMNSRKYYRKFVDEIFRKQEGKELSDPDFDYIYQLFFEQQAELERYKQCLPYLDHQSIDFCGIPCNFMEDIVEKARAEAIKEFEERLKEEAAQPRYACEMSEEGLYNYIKVMEGEGE